jgi:Tol biopolymer transport system component
VYASRRERRYQVRVLDPAAREDRAVPHGTGDHEDPSWAPDGRHIVCTRTVQYVPSLYILDALGDPPVRLTTLAGEWYSPAWSPR